MTHPINTPEREALIKLIVGMYNAAPGAQYLNDVVALYQATGHNLIETARVLSQNNIYRTIYPNFQTPDEFATEFLTTFGLQTNTFAREYIISRYNAGVPKYQIQVEALLALNNTTSTEFAAAKAILQNKYEVAVYYSVTKEISSTSTTVLQGVVSGITSDAATVTQAKANIDSGAQGGSGTSFTLTVNQDTGAAFTGGSSNDTFTAPATQNGAGALINTLQNVDVLNGGEGTDTLNATLSEALVVSPTLRSIEQVNVRFANATAGLDLANATGVTVVTVAESTTTGTVSTLGAIASLAVKNQTANVNFTGSTATTLALNADTAGRVAATGVAAVETVIDLGSAAASPATTLNVTVNASNIEIKDTTGAGVDTVTAATIAATGASEVKFSDGDATMTTLTVTGAGSVHVDSVMTALKTATAGDGGLRIDTTGGVLETATTGAGTDRITTAGAALKSVTTGAGNDTVTVAAGAVPATATIDLGTGNDTVSFAAAPTAGVTVAGNEGTDTIGFTTADYATVSAFSAANLAKITGFETLSITDLLTTSTYDVSKISGITSFSATGGITAGATATVSNLGANATVTFAGANTTGALTASLKTDTSADTLNLVLNQTYAENNDATSTTAARTQTVTAAGIETITVNSTGTGSATFAGTTGTVADKANNTLALTDDNLQTLTVTGNQAFTYSALASNGNLTTVNASANTGGATISAALIATNVAVTGSATAANTLTGSTGANTIIGGTGADTITGLAGVDTLTGGTGLDKFVYTAATESTLSAMDTITDFTANTFGNGASGAAGTGAGAAASRTGDVIQIDVNTAVFTKVAASAFSNATDVQIYIQNTANADANDTVIAAIDSSSGKLYIDWTSDGTVDSVIQLTGVTTINAAAFELI